MDATVPRTGKDVQYLPGNTERRQVRCFEMECRSCCLERRGCWLEQGLQKQVAPGQLSQRKSKGTGIPPGSLKSQKWNPLRTRKHFAGSKGARIPKPLAVRRRTIHYQQLSFSSQSPKRCTSITYARRADVVVLSAIAKLTAFRATLM